MAAIWPLLFKRQNLSIFPFTPPQKPPVTSLATVAVWGVFSSSSNIAAAITSQTFASLSRFRRAARYSGLNRAWRGGHHQPTPPHRPATKVPTSHSLFPSEGLFSWGRGRLFSWGRGWLFSWGWGLLSSGPDRAPFVPGPQPHYRGGLCQPPPHMRHSCIWLHVCVTVAVSQKLWGGIATVTDVGLVSG